MATPSTSSRFDSREGKTNGFKLMRLIIDLGTEALRNEFKKKHPGSLHTLLGNCKSTLTGLKKKNIITQPQWDKLYPSGHMIPNIQEFDITLLVILLRNICGIPDPSKGWNKLPNNEDTSLGANIVRVKLFRNEFFGHIPDTGVSTKDFESRWKEVSKTLVKLGVSEEEIDRLKDEDCGEEEVDRIRTEWSKMDTKVALKLLGIKKILRAIHSDVKSIKAEKTSSDSINLNKYLDSCNFDTEREFLNQKCCKGTREWVFDQVSDWFNDTTSDRRAFIITGQAGMGKSVIAAVICKRFAKQLAACHFCQYNNNRYNDPKILLQSLATQLSNIIPDYKAALIENLSSKKGQRLDDMDIKGLFSLLFKESLTGIKVAKKHLIVIDAVDESQHEGRSDLVDLIANYLCQLPSFIRFLVTSRPQNDIARKLKKMKPMFLSRNNEQNIKDIQHFFEDKLAGPALAKHINRLIEKSDGLMLFADCLYQILKDCQGQFNIDDLPTGIEEIYESYFRRLKSELEILKVTPDVYSSFLSVIAVAKQPLPVALISRIFSLDNDSSACLKNKINKVKNCLSSLLAIGEDRISFFHKSVKDWLVESGHDFTVDEKLGHETLATICAREMDEIKMNGIKPPFDAAAEYALLYGIQHKLAGTHGEQLKTFIDSYVTDLEIMYASIIVDVYATFDNMKHLTEQIIRKSLSEKTRKTVETLMVLIKQHNNIFRDCPQSFLQQVLNWGGDELSSNANFLLKSRYDDLAYFEIILKNSLDDSLVGRRTNKDEEDIISIDISPSEDLVICGYRDDKIELLSLVDFRSLWVIENVKLSLPGQVGYSRAVVFRPLVFHPHKNVILAGRLDRVYNLKGEIEPGPFSCKDINPQFMNCCFSNDLDKMVTTYENNLTVWDLVNNERLKSFSSDAVIASISFSANCRYFATSDEGKRLVVYDLERNFFSISNSFDHVIIFISTFMSDSWYCCFHDDDQSVDTFCHLHTVSFDLAALDDVPSTCRCIPLNVKAVAEFEAIMATGQESWFNHFFLVSFFCLDNGNTLVWDHVNTHTLQLFRVSKLKAAPSLPTDYVKNLTEVALSVDGNFLYLQTTDSFGIYEVHSHKPIVFSSIARNFRTSFGASVANDQFIYLTYPDAELWSSDLTHRLDSFPQLSGTIHCFLINERVVACIMAERVCFFDVVKKKIISTTRVPENFEVIACSSKYHVLGNNEQNAPSMRRAGKVVHEWVDIFNKHGNKSLRFACFSPSGNMVCFEYDDEPCIFICGVSPAKLHLKIEYEPPYYCQKPLKFLDENHFLGCVYFEAVGIISVASGKVLTCIDVGGAALFSPVSGKRDDGFILCITTVRERVNLLKVWLPCQTNVSSLEYD